MNENLILTKKTNDEVILMEVLSKAKAKKVTEDTLEQGEEVTDAQVYLLSKNHSKSSNKKNVQWLELP